ARVLGCRIVVGPKIVPMLTAKVTGGRLVPGGQAEVDAELSDGAGKSLTGSVSAVLIDAQGGGTLAGLDRLDTRALLCDAAGVEHERCAKLFTGDATLDAGIRAHLARNAEL